MIGMEDETIDDINMTDCFADELNLDEYGFNIICPFPGTAMYSESPDKFADVDWSETDEPRNRVWHTKHFTNEQLRELQDKLNKKYKDRITWHNSMLIK
jgi:radical SAM superfamily enzyme YgiQ (UPF0313 family)